MCLEHQINLEWFLKDQVTLKNNILQYYCSLSSVHSTLGKLRPFGNAPWVCRLSKALIESRQFIGWWCGRSYVTCSLKISLPSRSGHINSSPLATAVVELRSPRNEVPWSIVAVSHRVLASSRATTRTVSVLNVWVFLTRARWFMVYRNANSAKTSISKPSALGLRFLRGSHPFFPIVLWRPLGPSVNSWPGAQTWSSRRWRASRRGSPFLSLFHLNTCAWLDYVLFTAASNSEDFGPALAAALPPSGQEAWPSKTFSTPQHRNVF